MLWGFGLLFVTVSLSTVVWLKIVFTRYETTKALPVEYGTVAACSVLSGLLFYREFDYMSAGNLALSLVGLFTVIAGVGVSIRTNLVCGGGAGGRTAQVAPSPPAKPMKRVADEFESAAPSPSASPEAAAKLGKERSPSPQHASKYSTGA